MRGHEVKDQTIHTCSIGKCQQWTWITQQIIQETKIKDNTRLISITLMANACVLSHSSQQNLVVVKPWFHSALWRLALLLLLVLVMPFLLLFLKREIKKKKKYWPRPGTSSPAGQGIWSLPLIRPDSNLLLSKKPNQIKKPPPIVLFFFFSSVESVVTLSIYI